MVLLRRLYIHHSFYKVLYTGIVTCDKYMPIKYLLRRVYEMDRVLFSFFEYALIVSLGTDVDFRGEVAESYKYLTCHLSMHVN